MKAKFVALLSAIIAVQLMICPSVVSGGMVFPWPLVTTSPAAEITVSTAVLNGELTRLTQYVPCALVSFMYGEKPGEYTIETTPQLKCDNGTFSASIANLRPCTRYYVIAKATRSETTTLPSTYNNGYYGAGFGLNFQTVMSPSFSIAPCTVYGDEVSFQTACPPIRTGGGSGSVGTSSTGPSNMSNIVVQSATVATVKVSPGEKVDIGASVVNKGGSNGTAKVTLYINGQEAESKGIALSSGESASMHFSVSRNDPGKYTVLVNSVPAGSFTVDLFTNNDALIYGIIAFFAVAIVGVLCLVFKPRNVS
jgi:hypothetical protein